MAAEKARRVARAGQAEGAPIPPRHLIERTDGHGRDFDDASFFEYYEQSGRQRKHAIVDAVPGGYSFEGKRVLDFGCGAGRVLHEFLPEASRGEFWGCDLHEPTIAWLERNLSPPLRFYVNDPRPALPHPDGYFDLVYAISVFSHITHEWSEWLLELHRILKPDGLLVATFVGPTLWKYSLRREVPEDDLGMGVVQLRNRLDDTSGPVVLHSPWWIRAHWGRAFEILELRGDGFVSAGEGQGVVVGRKKEVKLTRDDLEWPEAGDPRELRAHRQQIALFEREAEEMLERWEGARASVAEQRRQLREQGRALGAQGEQEQLLRAMLGSRAFAVAEQLSRLHGRGRPVFSRQRVRRALGDEEGRP
jgi:SAM-dependent methyltransferase